MKRRPLLTGFLLCLTGCAAIPPGSQRYAGRFSLSVRTPEGPRHTSGRFSLLTSGESQFRLDLLTPLAGVIARIEVTPAEARLIRGADQPEAVGRNAEELLTELLGFPLPVGALHDLLTASAPAEQIELEGWNARILRRTPTGGARTLRIVRTDSAPQLTLTVTLDD